MKIGCLSFAIIGLVDISLMGAVPMESSRYSPDYLAYLSRMAEDIPGTEDLFGIPSENQDYEVVSGSVDGSGFRGSSMRPMRYGPDSGRILVSNENHRLSVGVELHGTNDPYRPVRMILSKAGQEQVGKDAENEGKDENSQDEIKSPMRSSLYRSVSHNDDEEESRSVGKVRRYSYSDPIPEEDESDLAEELLDSEYLGRSPQSDIGPPYGQVISRTPRLIRYPSIPARPGIVSRGLDISSHELQDLDYNDSPRSSADLSPSDRENRLEDLEVENENFTDDSPSNDHIWTNFGLVSAENMLPDSSHVESNFIPYNYASNSPQYPSETPLRIEYRGDQPEVPVQSHELTVALDCEELSGNQPQKLIDIPVVIEAVNECVRDPTEAAQPIQLTYQERFRIIEIIKRIRDREWERLKMERNMLQNSCMNFVYALKFSIRYPECSEHYRNPISSFIHAPLRLLIRPIYAMRSLYSKTFQSAEENDRWNIRRDL